jgi:flavin-dependent dehydrogenase
MSDRAAARNAGAHADVLVVGAGPAGAIAAIVLARAGLRVTVFDRARFPRDKLCGDTINPGTLAILRRLALEPLVSRGLPVDGMIVTSESGARVEGRYSPGTQGRALRRWELDVGLLRAASTAGAHIEEGVLVKAPLVEDGRVCGVMVSGSRERRVIARLVIAADGGSSRIARALRLAHHARSPRRWAVGAYAEGVTGTTSCGEMHVRRSKYIGVAPLSGGLTNICVVSADRTALRQPERLLWDSVRGDAQLADRFARSRLVAPPVCLGPLAVESTTCGMPGLLLAGDAAGFIDPMTGDGLRFACRGGELAAEAALAALERGDEQPHTWLQRARRREFLVKWRFNRALRSLVASPIALDVAAGSAEWFPGWVQRAIRYAGDEGKWEVGSGK